MRDHQYFVYNMSSTSGSLDVGIANNIYPRALQHKTQTIEGFTSKDARTRIVHYATFEDVPGCHWPGKRTERLDRSEENRRDIQKSKVVPT